MYIGQGVGHGVCGLYHLDFLLRVVWGVFTLTFMNIWKGGKWNT